MSKTREIVITPTTRIEGNGKVAIILDDQGNVSEAYFQATEVRGFEYFLRGMEAEKLPFTISRICGVCSTAHMIASVKTIENICSTEITETAQKIRELLLMGQIISNHSLVFYFLILPDFWFPLKEDPSKRNIFQIMREKPEIGKKALKLRSFGTNILNIIGGREVHIISLIPGGLIKPITEKNRKILLEQANDACALTQEALSLGKTLFEKNWDELKTLTDCCETSYMGMISDNAPNYYQGKVHLINSKGNLLEKFSEENFFEHIQEESSPWTYSKSAFYKGLNLEDRIMQVGPTARMNVSKKISTELANEELKYFKAKFGTPAHDTLIIDYARLIDLLYSCERARELLEEEKITRSDVRVPIKIKAGKGVGIVEAPRGTLAHQYTLTRTGKLRNMRLIIPTQINNEAINMSIKSIASKFIRNGEVKEGFLNRVEMFVRAYDPCIKCATRLVNNNIVIEIRDLNGKIIKTI